MDPKEVLEFAKEKDVKMVDLKFLDILGTWQHFLVPIDQLEEDSFEDGFGFDGSSIRGWQPIHASDMLVIPDPDTALIDPFIEATTLSLICNIVDPITKESYDKDPRYIAQKAEKFLKESGIGDTAYIGPEAEFFIFDDIKYAIDPEQSFYSIDSTEGIWNTGAEEGPNLGYKIKNKEGYFPVLPADSLTDLRNEMVEQLINLGIEIEAAHHEVATAGQAEIDMKYDTLLKMGDKLMWFKYVIRNVARKHGKVATFMPKPLYNDNGSGMHTHQSIWKDGKPLFAGDQYGGLSEMAMYYIGGLIKHAKALTAFSNPTVNSYRRLIPGFEAPVNLAYSSRNRSAAIRIPMYSANPKTKRLEVRFPDATANGYLEFASMLMAGIDGIINKIDPGQPLDKDIYSLSPEELANVPHVPASLEESLQALADDHEFLLRGDVFTEDVIQTWIGYKTEIEIAPLRQRPTPYEFYLYFDA